MCKLSSRIGGCGRDLALPRLPTGGGATAPGAVGRSDWSTAEALDSPVQPSLAEAAAECSRRSRPLDCGDSYRAVAMTTKITGTKNKRKSLDVFSH